MPHVTIHYLAHELRQDALQALPDAIAAVVAQHLDVDRDVVTVSLSAKSPEQWDPVLERAEAEGAFLRLPNYPTNARLTRIE